MRSNFRRLYAAILLGTIAFASSGCKNKETKACSPNAVPKSAYTRTEPRKEVLQTSLVLTHRGNEWVATDFIKRRKYQDRQRHYYGSGRVELYVDIKESPIYISNAEGPTAFETWLFRTFGKTSNKRIETYQQELLEGTQLTLDLPAIPIEEAESRSFDLEKIRYVRWVPHSGTQLQPAKKSSILKKTKLSQSTKKTIKTLGFTGELILDLKSSTTRHFSHQLFSLETVPKSRATQGMGPDKINAPFPFKVMRWTGHPRNQINLLILPDGYTAEEMEKFRADTDAMVEKMYESEPFLSYASLINIVRVEPPSEESGANCDDLKYSIRKNRYGSGFPIACANAVLDMDIGDRYLFQNKRKKVEMDSAAVTYDGVSFIDEIFVLVNSPKKAGAALNWASQTNASAWTTAAHELGHSWGSLADEYISDGDLCHFYMKGLPNLQGKTQKAKNVIWRPWLTPNIPLPTSATKKNETAIGLYRGGGGGCKKSAYRPMQTCKMESSKLREWCPPCLEQMILRLYDRINLIQGDFYRNQSGKITADVRIPKRLWSRWTVDGEVVQESHGYHPLTKTPTDGKKHFYQLHVFDEVAPVRKDRCYLLFAKGAWHL